MYCIPALRRIQGIKINLILFDRPWLLGGIKRSGVDVWLKDTLVLSKDNVWVPGPAMGNKAYGGVCAAHIESSAALGGEEVTAIIAAKEATFPIRVGAWSCRRQCETWTDHGMFYA